MESQETQIPHLQHLEIFIRTSKVYIKVKFLSVFIKDFTVMPSK